MTFIEWGDWFNKKTGETSQSITCSSKSSFSWGPWCCQRAWTMTPVLRMRATRRTVSHSCCRYFYKHTGQSNTTLSSDSLTRAKTQHRTWRRRSAPAPPVLASWSLPCRWPPATLRSDHLSIGHSWTKVWAWPPARTHISSHWQLRMSCVQPPAGGAKTRDKRGAHQVVLQDRLVCDLCCCF